MKTFFKVLFITGIVAGASIFTQCKRQQQVVAPYGETLVEVLCSGPEYFTDNEYFRANSVGESTNQANSKRMALSNARAEMAGQLSVLVRGVVDNYFQQYGSGDRSDYVERYEGLFREVVDERLQGTRIICEQVTRTQEGSYKTYIALELAGNEILNLANQRISNDERLRLDYDYENFKKTFDQEIEKLRQERGY